MSISSLDRVEWNLSPTYALVSPIKPAPTMNPKNDIVACHFIYNTTSKEQTFLFGK
jgi:hypothetical protein